MGRLENVILLDTHVLVWLTSEPGKLSKAATSAIRKANRTGGIAISAITLWELAWMVTYGRLQVAGTVESYLEEVSSRVAIRPITAKIAALANQFPYDYSSDPWFDRSNFAKRGHGPGYEGRKNSRLQTTANAVVNRELRSESNQFRNSSLGWSGCEGPSTLRMN